MVHHFDVFVEEIRLSLFMNEKMSDIYYFYSATKLTFSLISVSRPKLSRKNGISDRIRILS